MRQARTTIVKSVAHELHLSEVLVEKIFNRIVDNMVEELIENGELKVSHFFSIKSNSIPGYETDKGVVPPHRRFSVRLSRRIRTIANRYQEGFPMGEIRDTWRNERI